MRERIRDIDRLRHILECITTLQENRTRHTLNELLADKILFYGFVKEVEIIGEAVYKLTKEFRLEHSEVEWDDIEAMRHVLVHGYYQITPTKVWNTINRDLEPLRPLIEKYIAELTMDRPK